jgi:hypothetical protein
MQWWGIANAEQCVMLCGSGSKPAWRADSIISREMLHESWGTWKLQSFSPQQRDAIPDADYPRVIFAQWEVTIPAPDEALPRTQWDTLDFVAVFEDGYKEQRGSVTAKVIECWAMHQRRPQVLPDTVNMSLTVTCNATRTKIAGKFRPDATF